MISCVGMPADFLGRTPEYGNFDKFYRISVQTMSSPRNSTHMPRSIGFSSRRTILNSGRRLGSSFQQSRIQSVMNFGTSASSDRRGLNGSPSAVAGYRRTRSTTSEEHQRRRTVYAVNYQQNPPAVGEIRDKMRNSSCIYFNP